MKTVYILLSEDGIPLNCYTTLAHLCRENTVKRCTAAKGLLKKDVHRLRDGRTIARSTLKTSKTLGKKGGNRFK